LNRVSLTRRLAVGVLATAALLVPNAAFGQGNNPTPQQRGIVLASPAVVFIQTNVDLTVKGDFVEGGRRTTYRETFPYGTGSGFAVSPDGAVVTAAHVVQPSETDIHNYGANQAFAASFDGSFPSVAEAIRASFQQDPFARWTFPQCTSADTSACIFPAEQKEYNACFQARICDFEFEPVIEVFSAVTIASETVTTGDPAEVIDSTEFGTTDVALLETQMTNSPTVPLAESVGDIQSGARVAVLGFGASTQGLPTGLTEPQKSFGQVSTIRPEGTSELLEVNVQAEGGFSGGPVIDNSGRVIGLLSFDIITAEGESPQEFVRVVDDIRALIGDRASSGPVDTNFRRAMELFWGNHFSASIPVFRSVLDLNPGHPLATENLAEARQKAGTPQDIPVPEPSAGFLGLPIWLWGVIAAVIVAIIVLLLVMSSRRRKAPAAAAPGYAAPPAGFGAPAAQPPAAPAAQPPAAPAAQPPAAPTQARPPAAPSEAQPPAGVGAGQAAEERRPVGFQGQPPAGETTASQQPSSGEAPPPPGIGTAKFCSNCGMENASDATYCARCGHTIS
jgi:serine protease Do